ncbi:DUF4136 domain-containing protein [Colwellia sp. E150_009]
MTYLKKMLVMALVVFIASCATTYKAKVYFDKNSDVDTQPYKTFAWLTDARIIASPEDFNPVMKLRVDKEIEQAFISQGYQLIADANEADFTISYTVGSREQIKISHYPLSYRGGFGWGRGYYGAMFGPMVSSNSEVRQYTEGKLAIDVFDVKSHQPAWHGWATKRMTSKDKEMPSSVIKDVVKEVVSQFH